MAMSDDVLIIDNYDSFVFNLMRYTRKLGFGTNVVRNDDDCLKDDNFIRRHHAIIISPGPCAPAQAGYSKDVIEEYGPVLPILGVCLGHQAIGEVYGGHTMQSGAPVHGKTAMVTHDGSALFEGIPTPFEAMRYHSLISIPEPDGDLIVTARTGDIVMALAHKDYPVYGIQFHPESVLTKNGMRVMENFFVLAEEWPRNGLNMKGRHDEMLD